jgi:hypothetical protein
MDVLQVQAALAKERSSIEIVYLCERMKLDYVDSRRDSDRFGKDECEQRGAMGSIWLKCIIECIRFFKCYSCSVIDVNEISVFAGKTIVF